MPHTFVSHASVPAATAGSQRSKRDGRRKLVLATVCGAAVMVNLDLSAVNIALGDIQTDLGLSVGALAWVLNGYTVAFACLIAVAGRLGDMRGRRAALVAGAAVFVVASALCGLAQGEAWLIGARVVQGGGAALMFPAMLAIAAVVFPGAERALAVGTVIAVASVSQSIGPLVGGALTELVGWRSIFFVNVPIGIAVVIAAMRYVPESRDEAAPQRLDWVGAALLTVGLATIMVALDQAGGWGWASPATIGSLLVGLAALALFALTQFRVSGPLIGPELLRNGNFQATNVAGSLLYFIYFPMLMYAALLMQTVMGYGPLEAGLGLLPLVVLVAFLSRPVAKLSVRTGPTLPMTVGLVVAGVGALWLGLVVGVDATYVDVVGPLIVFGAGVGLAVALNASTAVGSVAPAQAGTASGVNFGIRLTGGAIGLAIITTMFEDVGSGAGTAAAAFVDAFGPAMFVLAAVAGIGAVFNQAFVRAP